MSRNYNEIEAEKNDIMISNDKSSILKNSSIFKDQDSDDNNNEDMPKCNPKNLPMGWDGKPIPYWLYKLHGLGIEFKCEICGGASYWGRRAFEKHF